MSCPKNWENCKICQECDNGAYVKEQVEGFVDFIRWKETAYLILIVTIFYLWFSWIGIPIALFIHYWTACAEGGAVGDVFGQYPYQEPEKLPCSAGFINCEYCGNGYSHDFNERYDKQYRPWAH